MIASGPAAAAAGGARSSRPPARRGLQPLSASLKPGQGVVGTRRAYDVAVLGGGAVALRAALELAASGRKVRAVWEGQRERVCVVLGEGRRRGVRPR